MRKTPACLMLIGLSFTFFTLSFMGVDLLIDAVGWLVVFNAVRVFRRLVPAFGPVHWLSLGLVAVSALQLFFTDSAVSLALWLVRCGLEAMFYFLVARGAAGWPAQGSLAAGPAAKGLCLASWLKAAAGLCLMLLFIIMRAGSAAAAGAIAGWMPTIDTALMVLNVAYLAALAWFAFAPAPKTPAP